MSSGQGPSLAASEGEPVLWKEEQSWGHCDEEEDGRRGRPLSTEGTRQDARNLGAAAWGPGARPSAQSSRSASQS